MKTLIMAIGIFSLFGTAAYAQRTPKMLLARAAGAGVNNLAQDPNTENADTVLHEAEMRVGDVLL